MCFSIGPVSQANRGPLGRWWWRLASQPLRVFGLLILIQLLVLSMLAFSGYLPLNQHTMELVFYQLHFALLGPLLLALLMQYFPDWYGTSETGYPVSVLSYNLVFFGLLFMDLGFKPGSIWPVAGGLLLLLGWWVMGNSLSAMSLWARGMPGRLRKVLKMLVVLMLLLQMLHLMKLSGILLPSVSLVINLLDMIALSFLLLTVVLLYARKPASPGLL